MTNEEIIDVVSAHEAGMRIEWLHGSQWLAVKPRWNFQDNKYRINPKDADKWERIKAPDTNFHCKVEYPKVMPGELPPVAEHTFPECAPPKQDPGYGYDLDGKKIEPPSEDHEIIPEGMKVHDGEVTHWYLGNSREWLDPTALSDNEGGVFKDAKGIAKVVPPYGGAIGNIRAYARLKYSVLHERSGIKPGDVVEVTRAAEDYERGWGFRWVKSSNVIISQKVKVVKDLGKLGFRVEDRDGFTHIVPAFVLRKVERRKVPLEALNWAGGPWCVKSVAGTPQLVTEVHEDWVVAGGGSVYRYANMMGMYRARGWSGDPDLEWLECWKYEDEESEAE